MAISSSTLSSLQKPTGFATTLPKPEPIRHTRTCTLTEVAEALRQYLIAKGVEVPEGKMTIMGNCSHGNLLMEITQEVELTLAPK